MEEEIIQTESVIEMPEDNPISATVCFLPPTPELIEYAKRELNEDPETRCQVLEEFRDLIYERGECTPLRMDDVFLLKYLRTKYFNVRHAHRMLVGYCNFKQSYPELFEDVTMTGLQKIVDAELIVVPPYREQTGKRMAWYKCGGWDPEKVSIVEILRCTFLFLEMANMEEKSQILGASVILDFEGLTKKMLWHITPTAAKQIFLMFTTIFPFRIEDVHVVNQSTVFGLLYNIFRPWMTDNMKKRIFFHGDDMKSLYEHIHPQFLPKRYGGVHPYYNSQDWIDNARKSDRLQREFKSLGFAIDIETLEKYKNERGKGSTKG